MTNYQKYFAALAFSMLFSAAALAQTSVITYQGKLTDVGAPATGQYDFTFKLFTTPADGSPNVTVIADDIQVTAGIFTVNLNFGSLAFTGNPAPDYFIEIAVRPGTDTGAYTTLGPRQPLTSSPYSIRTLSATSADSLSAACVLCVTDGHIVSIDGAKVTGTVPVANMALNIAGVVGIENGGTGSATKNFTDLTTNQTIRGRKTFFDPIIGDGSLLTNVNATVTDGSITTPKLADGSVTRAKLAVNFRNGFDPQQIALLRWDQIPVVPNHVDVGRTPSALAFDGTFIYVANKLDNNVMRIRTATGLVEGTPIAVGNAPAGLAFDGTFINVANSGGNSITRIRAATGVVEGGPIGVGSDPRALAFDGTFLYVANFGSNSVTRIRSASGAVEGTPISVGRQPNSLVFDGTFVYVSNSLDQTTGANGDVRRIRASTGTIEGSPINTSNSGALSFDGTFIYVANAHPTNGSVNRIRASTGIIEIRPIISGQINGGALVFDGTFLFASGNNNIFRLNINGLNIDGAPIPAFFNGVLALAFDGTYIYAASDRIFVDPNTGQTTTLNGNIIRF